MKGYVRTSSKTKREEMIKDLPVREILCESAHEDMNCPRCHSLLRPIGKETVREELEYIPAKLQIVRYVRMAYEYPKCKHGDKPYIQKANTPTSLMNHSLASPSSVAHVMYEKYVNSVPLYRQEKDWEQLGIALSKATMANWVIRCSQDYFTPVIEYLRKELISRDIIHCDETSVQVLKEEGKYRNGDHAVAFLKDFKGYVHSDGYSGYNKLTGIIRCGCLAHLRRKFVEAIPTKKSSESLSKAEIGRNYCDKLFQVEATLKDLTAEERFTKRLGLEKPILEAFWCWLESLNVLKGSALAKAVTYANNQKQYTVSLRLLKQMVLMFIPIWNICSYTCRILIGRIIQNYWRI